MKFTLGWLQDHLDTEARLEDILDALTDLGLEVEGVEDPEKTLGAFTIGYVASAAQHPDADRLRVCQVETAAGVKQIICGAPNARAGIKVVVAQPGDYVPGIETTLGLGVIRGVESQGMMCSEKELMLSEEHDGIIELADDAPVGEKFIRYAGLDDPTIEIAITPNRPDALGVYGIARDLAARGLGTLKSGAIEPVSGAFPSPIKVAIDPQAREACPHFAGRLVRGVKNGPSPEWLRRRLLAIGLRPINALVDITNFITFDRGRPLHVFDAARVSGNIKMRLSKPGEKLLALDGKTYEFDDAMTLVCDQGGRRPEAIGGVMGGDASGCTEDTTEVFIEAAYFDPVRTAATGRKLKIHSDARYRFERGVDPAFTVPGLEMATRMIMDLCGGAASEIVAAGKPIRTARKYKLDTERVVSLVGMEIPHAQQIGTLQALGFEVTNAARKIVTAAPPTWRPDVQGEADLVEEIARVASLTQLAAQPMARPTPGVLKPVLTPMQRRVATARRALAAAGLNECVTYTFVSEIEAKTFGGGDPALKLENPISAEMSDMRPTPLPGLLAAAARNQARGYGDLGVFEVGPAFFGPKPGDQKDLAVGVRIGRIAPREWSKTARPVDLYDAKADAEALLAAIGAPIEKLMLDRETSPWLHPGRSARLKLGPKVVLAEFGELHPKALKTMGLKNDTPGVAFSVDLAAAPFTKAKSTARPPLSLHDLQALERDFAFIVDARVEAEAVLRAAKSADKKLITDAMVFDVFEGSSAEKQFGAGKKSVAIGVRLQPTEKTLTDKDIEALSERVVAAVGKAVGAQLRG